MPLDPDEYIIRNRPTALQLRGRCVVIFGAGSVGSHIAKKIAKAGVNIIVVDSDTLEVSNLHRHEASAQYVGRNKAEALAETIKAEVPETTSVLGVGYDTDQLLPGQIRQIVSAADLVIAATGNHAADRRIEGYCLDSAIPFIIPFVHAGTGETLGNIHVVPYSTARSRNWGMACFTCFHPTDDGSRAGGGMVNAQPGLEVEISLVADYTTMLALALLLPDSERGRWLSACLDENVNYFLIPRTSPSMRLVQTERRTGCAGCSPAPETTLRIERRETFGEAMERRLQFLSRIRWRNLALTLAIVVGLVWGVSKIGDDPRPIRTVQHVVAATPAPAPKKAAVVKPTPKPKPKAKPKCEVYAFKVDGLGFSTPARYLAAAKREHPNARSFRCVQYG